MKQLPHNLGKVLAITALAVLALALVVVAGNAAPALAAPPAQTGTTPPVPAAKVNIIAVPANAALPNAITTTVKSITDTAVGPKTTVIAVMTSGLNNVPISVPVKLIAQLADPKFQGNVVWRLSVPTGSKAKLTATDKAQTSFTPDIVGFYMATANFATADGKTNGATDTVRLHAGMYEGESAGKCSTCHPQKAEEWAKTGHAKIFSDEVDNLRTPDIATHYAERCASCHNTGFYPAPFGGSGGYYDAVTKTKWQFPTFKQIDAAGKGGASNFKAAPDAVKNVANIQCEVCHGPAQEHVTNGARVMASSQDEGVCNQCHNGGGHHLKGTDLQNAAHADQNATAWNTPVGPAEQACVRCHSGNGYVSFLADPKSPAAWDNTKQTVVCSTCHDPHSEANIFQLRIVSKPIELPFQVTKDVGLSATCYECHNARNSAADAAKGQTGFPHYSSVAEWLSDTGGVTYGKTIPNSPHGMLVGAAPVANPAWKEGSEDPKFLFSKADDTKGNIPGACVTCHMWPTIEDAKDPNYHKVGSHSFNTVSPDGKFDYTAGCKSCHGDQKDFNFKAKADYDGDGTVAGVQDEVTGLINTLWKQLEAKGLKKVDTGYPYATLPKAADGTTDPKITNAWYNFRNVYGVMWGTETGNGNQGKAQAVHNFQRSVALLQLSYKDLTGQDVPGATILVK